MNSPRVRYECDDQIAVVVMDDGEHNLVSPIMLRELGQALDRAEREAAVVVLAGREGVFSAGFDLKILKRGVGDAFSMLTGGFGLATRLLAFPKPVVVACPGHAIAMGAFLLLAGDLRIGVRGAYKIVTNEVAIGLTMPHAGIELCRQRLQPAHVVRAALLAEAYAPDAAVEAGFLDRVVAEEDLLRTARETARGLAALDPKAHTRTKHRLRRRLLRRLRRAMLRDRLDFVKLGVLRLARGWRTSRST